MKCEYCGSNLTIEDAVCPYCGKANAQAGGHRALMKKYRDRYERTKADAAKKSEGAGRRGRLIVIGLMLLAILFMGISIGRNSDVEYREKKKEEKIADKVDRNRDEITATLKELEENREYIALENYMLNYRLRRDDEYGDYSRVFTAVINHTAICEDILNILDGYEGYDGKTSREWCDDAAIYISNWRQYVDGQFWQDGPDSSMHAGEHGAFLADIRKDTQDIVQVYFDLTDEQASSMWDMEKEALGSMLYEKCRDLYPEGGR